MKTWFIALPFVFACAFAQADEASAPPAAKVATGAEQAKPQPIKKVRKHRMKRMAATDRRACLEQKTNAEIIRCAEQRKKP